MPEWVRGSVLEETVSRLLLGGWVVLLAWRMGAKISGPDRGFVARGTTMSVRGKENQSRLGAK